MRLSHREGKDIDYVFKVLDIPWWCYAIAILVAVFAGKCWRWEGGLLAGYVFLLLAETVLIRKPFAGQRFQPEVLWSWREWNVQREQILTNLVMFIPVGLLAGRLCKWNGFIVGFGLSIFIETLQLITSRGLCEFDDVIHNMIGVSVGIGFVVLMKTATRRTEEY